MARLDTESYRRFVLEPVEKCFLETRDSIPYFTSFNFYQALRSELLRADPDSGMIEVEDDLCSEIDHAAERITDHMESNHDLGFGASS
jgi:hypothetical protein